MRADMSNGTIVVEALGKRAEFKNRAELRSAARGLVRTGAIFTPLEMRILTTFARLFETEPVSDRLDRRALAIGERNLTAEADPAPAAPTPFDDEIAAAERALDLAAARRGEAFDRMLAARRALDKATGVEWFHDGIGWQIRALEGGPKGGANRARDLAVRAELAYTHAAQGEGMARARLTTLRLAADRWRIEADTGR